LSDGMRILVAEGKLRALDIKNSLWADCDTWEDIKFARKKFIKSLIKKEDGLLDMNDSPEVNLRKVLAYSTWPGAHMIYKNKFGKDIRLVVKDAEIKDSIFVPTRITPAGKREMAWEEFLRGN